MTSVVSKATFVKMLAFLHFMWYNIGMENIFDFHLPSDITYGRGYVYQLLFHIVWCTKYRKHILVDGLDVEAEDYLRKTAKELHIDILSISVMPDHVHLLVSCRPQVCLSDAIKIFKGNVARWLFLSHPELKQKLWGGHLWNPSYFVATVNDRSREHVEAYVLNQRTARGKGGRPCKTRQ